MAPGEVLSFSEDRSICKIFRRRIGSEEYYGGWKITSRRSSIFRAIGEDAVGGIAGWIIGFSSPATLTAIVLEAGIAVGSLAYRRLQYLRPSTYLDWELKAWRGLYRKVDCLRVVHRNDLLAIPQQVIFDNSRQQYSLANVRVKLKRSMFELRPNISARTEEAFANFRRMLRIRRRRYSNDTNLRLCDVVTSEGSVTLVVQPVRYEDYARTNLTLDADFRGQGITLRNEIHASGQLEPLNESPLANNLGVNILIFSADGQLLIQRRSKSVIVRPGEYAPSASGTIIYTDVLGEDVSLDAFPIFREAYEELGLSIESLAMEGTELLGITRELIRGGEPEMFFWTASKISAAKLRSAWPEASDRFETRSLEFFDFGELAFKDLNTQQEKDLFSSRWSTCIDRFADRMSVPLWTALTLWKASRIGN